MQAGNPCEWSHTWTLLGSICARSEHRQSQAAEVYAPSRRVLRTCEVHLHFSDHARWYSEDSSQHGHSQRYFASSSRGTLCSARPLVPLSLSLSLRRPLLHALLDPGVADVFGVEMDSVKVRTGVRRKRDRENVSLPSQPTKFALSLVGNWSWRIHTVNLIRFFVTLTISSPDIGRAEPLGCL